MASSNHPFFDELVPYVVTPGADGSGEDGGRTAPPETIAADRVALAPALASLHAAGFYAYGMLDDQNRWTVAADDEAGRIDVRVGEDGFAVQLWASSPGLYADEDNEWRRKARERLARMTIQGIARGQLAPHEGASWDETELGVAVELRFELPFTRGDEIGAFVRGKLPELDELLSRIESQVAS